MTPRPEDCPLSRAMECIGELSSLDVLHELFDGHTQFEQIRQHLQLSSEVLSERLNRLVEAGLVDRFPNNIDAETASYSVAPAGRNLRPVLLSLAAWGNQYLLHEQQSMVLVDRDTGRVLEPVMVDRATGQRVDAQNSVFTAGPAASPAMRERYARQSRDVLHQPISS